MSDWRAAGIKRWPNDSQQFDTDGGSHDSTRDHLPVRTSLCLGEWVERLRKGCAGPVAVQVLAPAVPRLNPVRRFDPFTETERSPNRQMIASRIMRTSVRSNC